MKALKIFTQAASALVIVIAFQNCGQADFRSGGGSADVSATGLDTQKLGAFESATVDGNQVTPPRPEDDKITYVIPRAIEFGEQHMDYSWPCDKVSMIYPAPPCSPFTDAQRPLIARYSFKLTLANGLVVDNLTGDVLHKLDAQQTKELKGILSGTILAFPHQLRRADDPPVMACLAIYQAPYASLVTNRKNFELGSGSPGCAFDLYKRDTRANAGLKTYLDKLELSLGVIAVASAK